MRRLEDSADTPDTNSGAAVEESQEPAAAVAPSAEAPAAEAAPGETSADMPPGFAVAPGAKPEAPLVQPPGPGEMLGTPAEARRRLPMQRRRMGGRVRPRGPSKPPRPPATQDAGAAAAARRQSHPPAARRRCSAASAHHPRGRARRRLARTGAGRRARGGLAIRPAAQGGGRRTAPARRLCAAFALCVKRPAEPRRASPSWSPALVSPIARRPACSKGCPPRSAWLTAPMAGACRTG